MSQEMKDAKKAVIDLADRLNDKMIAAAGSDVMIESMINVYNEGCSLGMNDDLSFLLGFIIGRLARNNRKDEVAKYMVNFVDAQFDLAKGINH